MGTIGEYITVHIRSVLVYLFGGREINYLRMKTEVSIWSWCYFALVTGTWLERYFDLSQRAYA